MTNCLLWHFCHYRTVSQSRIITVIWIASQYIPKSLSIEAQWEDDDLLNRSNGISLSFESSTHPLGRRPNGFLGLSLNDISIPSYLIDSLSQIRQSLHYDAHPLSWSPFLHFISNSVRWLSVIIVVEGDDSMQPRTHFACRQTLFLLSKVLPGAWLIFWQEHDSIRGIPHLRRRAMLLLEDIPPDLI